MDKRGEVASGAGCFGWRGGGRKVHVPVFKVRNLGKKRSSAKAEWQRLLFTAIWYVSRGHVTN